MENIQLGAGQLLKASIAVNTQKAYRTALKTFNGFRKDYMLPESWPVPIAHLQSFISYLHQKGYASKTASTFLSAINFIHKINNLQDNSRCFSVLKMLEGYRRTKPSFDTRSPIMYDSLIEICKKLNDTCSSSYEAILFKAAYTCAFFGLFRVGELVLSSNDLAERPLFISDLHININDDSECMKIYLRKSKCNQHGVSNIVILNPTGTEVCPIKAMISYLKVRTNLTKYIFSHINGKPLTRYQFGAVLSKVIKALRMSHDNYRTHSFRIGAASWLASKGIPDKTIKKMGRWNSNAFLRYIRN